jgi:hypothetical protein
MARTIIPRDTGLRAINIVNAIDVIRRIIEERIIYNYKN